MICRAKHPAEVDLPDREGRCYSTFSCRDWGYCRERNIEAGGMKNVTPEMQAEWKRQDSPAPEHPNAD